MDFLNIMLNFYSTGIISHGCSSSYITLIPKITSIQSLSDFRPITLIGCIKKVISKTLANRFKTVITKVISPSQSAFLAERNILDGPLVLNEIINWLKKNKREAFCFKIDFEKAFDTVNWNFLLSVMNQMCFPSRWILWIKGILTSTRSSILVNGCPTQEFNCERGMPQGDPLSPFLFIIAMEAFSNVMQRASNLGLISGIQLPNFGPNITHLLYADDAILIGAWSSSYISNISRILRGFYLASGLKVNLTKSSFFWHKPPPSLHHLLHQNFELSNWTIPHHSPRTRSGGQHELSSTLVLGNSDL